MLVEAAFRARDRIDDAAIDFGPDRAVGRHADVGKGVLVQRQASGERSPADHQHRSGIVVSRGELAEPRYECGVAALLREVGYEVQDEVALADRIKDVRSMERVARIDVHRLRRRAQGDLVDAELGAWPHAALRCATPLCAASRPAP
jgi:hypothetical protein